MEYTDVIYGIKFIPEVFTRIINTDVFQRLKKIGQLGLLWLELPIPIYNRYEHCIGTYLRAREMLVSLEFNTPSLSLTNRLPHVYRDAVLVAALLHDVGHGPFSHSWEHINPNFNHERNGCACVDAIFSQLDPNSFSELRANNNFGIDLVKALITGDENFMLEKISLRFHYIFQIVHNTVCGLDVDKWDYLKRDALYLGPFCPDGLDVNHDFDDLFLNARISDNGRFIEYRYDEYHKIYDLFSTRWKFHKQFHHMPKVIAGHVLVKGMVQRCANGIGGKPLCDIYSTDMEKFLQLHDETVLDLIQNDSMYKYISNPNNIESVLKSESGKINGAIPKNSFEKKVIIPGPGVHMPPDNFFHFYGSESKKINIVRDTTFLDYTRIYFLH